MKRSSPEVSANEVGQLLKSAAQAPDGRYTFCGEWAMAGGDRNEFPPNPCEWLSTQEADDLTCRLFEASGDGQ